jgi:hypothetical protein
VSTIKNTIQNRILMANQYESFLTELSNSYIGIGRSTPWDQDDNEGSVPDAIESTQNINDVHKNMVFMKKIISADIMHVAPVGQWVEWGFFPDYTYEEYTDKQDLYTTNWIIPGTGTVTTQESPNTNVIGQNTTFTSTFTEGDKILVYGSGSTGIDEIKEIISIANDEFLTVNTAFNGYHTQNNYATISDLTPLANVASFYFVKNYINQVFKCIFNNGGVYSTFEPEIDAGGSLPENPYIETSDGYRWKYLYSLSSGELEKYYDGESGSNLWLPVKSDAVVSGSAVDGRIDIIKLINGGSGYLSNGNSSSANIISVIGNGTGANVTANVVNGVITGINILDGGSGYTNATIKVNGTGANANLIAVIGPKGGHGSNPIEELGASYLMISVELDENGGGKFPTENTEESFDFRQISIISNPKDSDGNFADNLRYNASYVVRTSTPTGGGRFYLDDYVYQGDTLANSTFSGTIAFWDENNNEIWLNNISGTITLPDELKSNSAVGNPVISVTAFQLTEPEIQPYSGDVLYVKNRTPVVRTTSGSELIRIIVSL